LELEIQILLGAFEARFTPICSLLRSHFLFFIGMYILFNDWYVDEQNLPILQNSLDGGGVQKNCSFPSEFGFFFHVLCVYTQVYPLIHV
jgi:hypothetical protein